MRDITVRLTNNKRHVRIINANTTDRVGEVGNVFYVRLQTSEYYAILLRPHHVTGGIPW